MISPLHLAREPDLPLVLPVLVVHAEGGCGAVMVARSPAPHRRPPVASVFALAICDDANNQPVGVVCTVDVVLRGSLSGGTTGFLHSATDDAQQALMLAVDVVTDVETVLELVDLGDDGWVPGYVEQVQAPPVFTASCGPVTVVEGVSIVSCMSGGCGCAALTLCMFSLLALRPLPPRMVVTGGLTLDGRAVGVGSLTLKLEAVLQFDLRTVFVPLQNLGEASEFLGRRGRRDIVVVVYEDIYALIRAVYQDVESVRRGGQFVYSVPYVPASVPGGNGKRRRIGP